MQPSPTSPTRRCSGGSRRPRSFDPLKVVRGPDGQQRRSSTRSKVLPAGARTTSAVYKYAAFLVKGKGPGEQKNAWDLFKVVGYQGGDSVMPTLKSLGY